MNKVILLLLVTLSLSATAQKLPYIDSTLKPYVGEYLIDVISSKVFPLNLSYIDSIIAVPSSRLICNDTLCNGCDEENLETKRHVVFVQNYNWYNCVDPDVYYRYLIYHELGHALFNLDHYDKTLNIMNTYCDGNNYGLDNWQDIHSKYMNHLKHLTRNKKRK